MGSRKDDLAGGMMKVKMIGFLVISIHLSARWRSREA